MGIIHNLRQSPYSFTVASGILNNRFVLRYTNSVLGNEDFIGDSNAVFVVSNESLTVTSLKENNAQNESKLDELTKENNSLKNEITSLKTERKDFETAFSKLRTQFNEMQLFNGKLVLLNKVLKPT